MHTSDIDPASRVARTDRAARNRVARWVAAITGLEAVSLAVASAMHLSGRVHGRGAPFDADHAGIAEALIGVVLAGAAIALWRSGMRARREALVAIGFAVAGFCWGLSITARAGRWPDISYHVVVLPVLVVTFIMLLRSDEGSGTGDRAG